MTEPRPHCPPKSWLSGWMGWQNASDGEGEHPLTCKETQENIPWWGRRVRRRRRADSRDAVREVAYIHWMLKVHLMAFALST